MIKKWGIYFSLFLLIFCTLSYGYYLADFVAPHVLIDDLTVRPAAAITNVVFPSAAAVAQGRSLISRFGRINILVGCEGAEGMCLLLAAILPYPAPWRVRLIGVLLGVLLIYALNLCRIVTLLAILHWHPQWFGSVHGIIAPTGIVMFAGLFFLIWTSANAEPERV